MDIDQYNSSATACCV